jgi:hypothetical protein
MTVTRMEDEMPNREYVNWSMYYAIRAQEAELAEKMAKARGGRR